LGLGRRIKDPVVLWEACSCQDTMTPGKECRYFPKLEDFSFSLALLPMRREDPGSQNLSRIQEGVWHCG
jgi:hypothetical protein